MDPDIAAPLLAATAALLGALGALRRRNREGQHPPTAGQRVDAAGTQASDRATHAFADIAGGVLAETQNVVHQTLTIGTAVSAAAVRAVVSLTMTAVDVSASTAATATGLAIDGAASVLDAATAPVRPTPPTPDSVTEPSPTAAPNGGTKRSTPRPSASTKMPTKTAAKTIRSASTRGSTKANHPSPT